MLLDLLYHHHRGHHLPSSEGSNASDRQKVRKLRRTAEYNQIKLRLQQDDQLVTDFIVALVTKGLFNGC